MVRSSEWEGLDEIPKGVPIGRLESRASSLTVAERTDVFWELCGPEWTAIWAGRREAERQVGFPP